MITDQDILVPGVTPIAGEPTRYFVPSGSRRGHAPHTVDMDDGGSPACSCEDFMARGNPRCRHIQAVQTFLKTN